MAARNFKRLQALQSEIKHVHAKVNIGATGAPTLVQPDSLGVKSVTRDNAGLYTLELEDKYVSLVDVSVKQVVASAQDLTFQLISEDVNGDKEVKFRCLTAAVATDPASGSQLLIKLELKNTTVK
jgi:hypothetical protein